MINLLKEKDIERGLTLLEYINWCKLYSPLSIANIKSSEECTKEEILNYSEKINKQHHQAMKNKKYKNEEAKMLKCWSCENCKDISKNRLHLSEVLEYTIVCEKENICFGVNWDAHISDLPCWKENENF